MYFCFRRGTAIELRIDYIIIILKKKKNCKELSRIDFY